MEGVHVAMDVKARVLVGYPEMVWDGGLRASSYDSLDRSQTSTASAATAQ